MQGPQLCSPGHYCEGSTGTFGAGAIYEVTENPCDAGTYSNKSGLSSQSQCTSCDGGQFCTGGGTSPDGEYSQQLCDKVLEGAIISDLNEN